MEGLTNTINNVFKFVTPISDFLWDFPTNFSWYKSIPLLGNFTLAIIVLVGSGIYFTFKLSFVQLKYFKKSIKLLSEKNASKTGISQLASFFLSTAMRVGPGNITGATGAIAVGGPGALFWMWMSAFFGMATAFIEGTLAQIFKEKNNDEFNGGLPYYGKKLINNSIIVGVFLSILYILYALCCLPAQGFNVVTAIGTITGIITNSTIKFSDNFYIIISIIVIILTTIIVFGGIKKVTKVTNKLVPIMAIVYCVTVLLLIIFNINRVPYFFESVFVGAFKPKAIFGGAFGVALAQGVKRGLMSNEAGQGTITMPAAASYSKHPVEQGFISSLGVFLDTIIICTLTGFVVVMGKCFETDGLSETFYSIDNLQKYNLSVKSLTIPSLEPFVMLLLTFCFALFAYTCLLGMVSFSEIAGSRITKNNIFKNFIRVLCIFVATFGILSNIAGLHLENLWAFSDLGNILIVYFNVPLLYLGLSYVKKALKHYEKNDNTNFNSATINTSKLEYWDNV